MVPGEPSPPNIELAPLQRAELTGTQLSLRIRQQEILSELGVLALQRTPLPELLDSAVRMAAEGLRADFSKVLEYVPKEKRLLLRAGLGWDPGLVGVASVGADLESPAGYALHTGKPVISNHLENEERFRTPDLLRTHGVMRAVNVILQGEGAPFGVLEVDSRSEGKFDEHDISFLQGAANILGMAIERQTYEQRLRDALQHQQLLMKEINHRVKNSLQLVSSMFHLQARATSDPAIVEALETARGRVNAIARVHERLYRDSEVTTVDLVAYLADVCADLKDVTAPSEIDFEPADQLRVTTDRAVQIALLIVELVTNSAKHAYPEGAAGRITTRIQRASATTISVSVRDYGLGVPKDFNPEQSRGFGMTILRAFLEQSGATLTVRSMTPGAEFLVVIPLE
jgi:two-component sensor histidine kinase